MAPVYREGFALVGWSPHSQVLGSKDSKQPLWCVGQHANDGAELCSRMEQQVILIIETINREFQTTFFLGFACMIKWPNELWSNDSPEHLATKYAYFRDHLP